ncbi:CDP-glycerol glycerophosphotransferase family protein [Pseudomonas citronellolis]|uniref:CDP-glycerol glycerophosphotransferase family protein n=1 Tax=Pseudomonas citronellolis TaxID=53408 RepID=UPI002111E401|nr:CDP-glycerol glycerophosphotransferase family protein [Pseudomonas citronellolis]UUC48964.1 CDP-glycerol glycerophosphotransferase family protein [Pseudomonas citronellolis]
MSNSKKILHTLRGLAIKALWLLQPFSKQKYIVVGSGFNRYIGYPRYLFEDFIKDPELSKITYWSYSTSNQVDSNVPSHENSIKKYSLKWFKIIFNSRCLIFSHDSTDITPIPPPWCIKINLWHGRPLKTIGFDSKIEQQWINFKLSNNISLPYSEWDYVFSYDKKHLEIISTAWRIPIDRVIHNFPRTPYIQAPKKEKDLGHIILYAPTFRDYDYFPTLLSSPELESWLQENNSTLLYRAHPSKGKKLISPENYSRVIDVTLEADLDKLFASASILISDYSSITFDFALTGKPNLLLWDDFYAYSASNSLYVTPEDVLPESLFSNAQEIFNLSVIELLSRPSTPFDHKPNKPLEIEQLKEIIKI